MIYLILAVVLYTVAVLVVTSASRNANTNLVALITEILSVLPPLLVILPKLAKKSLWSGQSYGLWMAALSGLAIGLFVLTFNKALTENKVGIVTPVVYGGSIFLSTVLSYFIYKEKVSLVEAVGLGLVLIGVLVVIYARATTA
jgi:uncharacterized membrane protein